MTACASAISSSGCVAFDVAGFAAGAIGAAAGLKNYQSEQGAPVLDDARSTLEHKPLAERLENWAHWCRASRPGGACIASLEGRWRSPQRGHWDPEGPLPAIVYRNTSTLDAEHVEHAVCLLPMFDHALVRAWHVYRMNPGLALRKAARIAGGERPHPRELEACLNRAYSALQQTLRVPPVVRRSRLRALVLARLEPGSGDSED